MARTRVLHIALNLDEGGLERILADLVQRADPKRFELHVLALEYLGRCAEGLGKYAQLHVAERLPRWSMVWPSGLTRQIREIAPAIVHTHSGVWYKASLAARRAGVPFLVHTDHGRQAPDPWQDRVTDGLASRRTDVIIAVSEVLARQLAATVVSDPSRIRVILNGVDTDRFRPLPDNGKLRAELGLAADVPVLGSIGRLDRIKGFEVMVEAFALLRRDWTGGSAPALVIAGDGPDRARLEGLVRASGVGDGLRILGWRDDIHDLHAAFAVYTMSSHSEGTSIGLLEAMSAGLCPVVTDVGGNAAVVGEALAHRLCPPKDAAALARAWRDALVDRAALREDGARARRRVEERFSLDAMVRAHEELYEQASARTGRLAGRATREASTAARHREAPR